MFALISGCPRSGTSALLRWLRNQPGVASFFESRLLLVAHAALDQAERFESLSTNLGAIVRETRTLVLRGYAETQWLAGRLLIDKEPMAPIALPDDDYERFLRHVGLIFPHRRLILMVRDPVATVWSMRKRKWGYSLTSGTLVEWPLDTCIDVWRRNARIACDHLHEPSTLVCRFENLVEHPVEESERIRRFLALRGSQSFASSPTKTIAFPDHDRAAILAATEKERRLLGY
jgi:hypothetical protein